MNFSKNEAIKYGFETTKKNFKFIVQVLIISALIQIVFNQISQNTKDSDQFLRFLIGMIMWLVGSVLTIGQLRIALNFVEGKASKLSDLYEHYPLAVNYIAATIIYGIIIAIGFILLVIPGIYLAIRLQYFSYLIVDKNLGPVEALKKSWEMTKDQVLNLFLLGLMLAGVVILGVLAFGVGLLWAIPTAMLASAWVYRKLAK